MYRSSDGAVVVCKDSSNTVELTVANFLETAPAAKVVIKGRIRVTVLLAAQDEDEESNLAAFWVELAFNDPVTNDWKPILTLHEVNYPTLMSALRETEEFLATVDRKQ